MIYLDNNATTPVDPAVLEVMLPFLRGEYGNASSASTFAKPVKKALALAREQAAALIDCEPEEILFTSGGTESLNTALFSATQLHPGRRHLIIGSTEHEAVLNAAAWLERAQGYEITRLAVDPLGRTDLGELAAAIRPDRTAAIALMWANNETGVLAPIPEAAAIAEAHGIPFIADAVQAAGKIPLSVQGLGIHSLALSGHKFHAPKGTGVLYVNRRFPFQPWVLGGGQENNRRAGTENTAGIAGLGAAAELARRHLQAHPDGTGNPVRQLRGHFESEALRRIPGTRLNGDPARRTPNTSSLRFDGTQAEGLILLLDQRGIYVSAGSACTTGSPHPSHVLTAMGLDPAAARSTVRFSFSRFNNAAEIEQALDILEKSVLKFRSLFPL
ncbi:MAG: aminotransferase class V-fold PLP-dependent enzyme [Verrucomicrobiota bacterium]